MIAGMVPSLHPRDVRDWSVFRLDLQNRFSLFPLSFRPHFQPTGRITQETAQLFQELAAGSFKMPIETRLPRVEIEFCTGCKWYLRCSSFLISFVSPDEVNCRL